MIRVFIAIPIPPDVAGELARLIPPDLGGLKRVAPELLHITLAFVGWLEEARLPAVVTATARAASTSRAFDVPLTEVGRFPETGRPRVVWAGTTAAPVIEGLGEAVRRELRGSGVAFDPKPLRPHVTLARVREDATAEEARGVAAAAAAARVPAGLRFRASGVQVMQSTLTPRGPRYSSRGEVPLPDGDPEVGKTQ